MKRILAFLLCLVMLCGVLAACDESPVTPPAETTTKPAPEETKKGGVDISKYSIVYSAKASDSVKDAANLLAAAINPWLDDEVMVSADNKATADADKSEILIGATNRQASKDFYTGASSAQFSVLKKDSKIVIAGHTDALTVEGVTYFIKQYLQDAEDGIIPEVTDYTGGFEKSVTFGANAPSYRIVYSRTVTQKATYMSDVVEELSTRLKTYLGVDFDYAYAPSAYNPTTCEIMVGIYDFDELKGAYEGLKLGGYVISVVDSKILIAATSETSYQSAIDGFIQLVRANMLQGTKTVVLKAGMCANNAMNEMLANIPTPVGLSPTDVLPAGDEAMLAVYENAGKANYDAYCGDLVKAGFTKYTETSFDGSAADKKNSFATYVSDKVTLDLAFHENNDRMTISVTPKGKQTLPAAEAPSYTAVGANYPTIMVQLGTKEFHPHEHAMCYILRLADGTFIIYDSAYGSYRPTGSTTNRQVADEIYAMLKKLAPNPNNIVIAAWITTHPHTDHMGGLVQFANTYATGRGVTVKQFVQNFAANSIATGGELTNQEKTMTAIKKFGAKVELVKPRTGNVLYYADVKFNVMYTQEDYVAATRGQYYDGNTSTLVTQLITADGCKVFIGGDHAVSGVYDGVPFCDGALYKWYGDFIQSDVVTMFHHGLGGGADTTIYTVIKPRIVLWPGTWERIYNNSDGTPYGTALINVAYNKYFTDLEPDTFYETPNKNGVQAWYVSDDGLQIVSFIGGKAAVAHYETRAAFLG